ncbi:hypothetical protein G6M26_05580 [Agrobacterium tumefaciens]|nr:hypothetical protein [Agrobacterium tumefaciens]
MGLHQQDLRWRRHILGGVLIPLLMDGFLVQLRISVDQPTDGVREPSYGRFGCAFTVIATGSGH